MFYVFAQNDVQRTSLLVHLGKLGSSSSSSCSIDRTPRSCGVLLHLLFPLLVRDCTKGCQRLKLISYNIQPRI
ncbi:hypothetical protein M758_1G105400 [Ceratodon purpureus]|nr:hypothetical protein M758_1G105400 [Ceratodon purpureus]